MWQSKITRTWRKYITLKITMNIILYLRLWLTLISSCKEFAKIRLPSNSSNKSFSKSKSSSRYQMMLRLNNRMVLNLKQRKRNLKEKTKKTIKKSMILALIPAMNHQDHHALDLRTVHHALDQKVDLKIIQGPRQRINITAERSIWEGLLRK